MNRIMLSGRLTADTILDTFKATGNEYVNFTVAVDRDYKDKDGNRPTDFIPCFASGSTAKFINKYFHKGDGIEIIGTWEHTVTGEGENRKYFDKCHVMSTGFPPARANRNGADAQTAEFDKVEDDGELPF